MYRSNDHTIFEGFCTVTRQSTHYNLVLNLVETGNVKVIFCPLCSEIQRASICFKVPSLRAHALCRCFRKFSKWTIMEQFGSHWTDFH